MQRFLVAGVELSGHAVMLKRRSEPAPRLFELPEGHVGRIALRVDLEDALVADGRLVKVPGRGGFGGPYQHRAHVGLPGASHEHPGSRKAQPKNHDYRQDPNELLVQSSHLRIRFIRRPTPNATTPMNTLPANAAERGSWIG